MGILLKCPSRHSPHPQWVHVKFHLISCLLFLYSPQWGKFKHFTLLDTFFPLTTHNVPDPLLMHHWNGCNITGNTVQYVHLWAILRSDFERAIQMISDWLRSLTYGWQLCHAANIGTLQELRLTVVDVLHLDDKLWLRFQRVVGQPVSGLSPERVEGLLFPVQSLSGMDVSC